MRSSLRILDDFNSKENDYIKTLNERDQDKHRKIKRLRKIQEYLRDELLKLNLQIE